MHQHSLDCLSRSSLPSLGQGVGASGLNEQLSSIEYATTEDDHRSVSVQSSRRHTQNVDVASTSREQDDTNEQCHGHICCKKLFAELTTLKQTVSTIYVMMLEKNNMGSETQVNHIKLDLDIKCLQQLDIFEEKLKDPAVAAQYKQMVKRIGGKTYEKHVRNALSLTISDNLAYRMSWTGAKGTTMARNMLHIAIIKDCIKNEWSSATDNLIDTVIKNWLQHAGDRLRPKIMSPSGK